MIKWVRPYKDPIRVFTAGLALFGTGFAAVVTLSIVRNWQKVPVEWVLVIGGFCVLWLTFTWRLHRTGLLTSVSGVRVRWLLLTRTFPWSEIQEFETDDDYLETTRLWIRLVDGARYRTPVQQVPRLFNGSRVSDGGVWLRSDAYARTLATLRRRLAAARSRE